MQARGKFSLLQPPVLNLPDCLAVAEVDVEPNRKFSGFTPKQATRKSLK
jgi:hypothetical protein